MLQRKVALHDIDDVEAFVIMCVKRSGCNAPSGEWDDLICEGIALLYRMAGNYKAQLSGYTSEGRFSGYAVKWLPKQIKQSWHRSKENHLYRTQADGKRKWEFHLTPVSYEVSVLSESHKGHTQHENNLRLFGQFVDVPTVDVG